MVVRLKDIREGKQEKKPSGVVRLSDIRASTKENVSSVPFNATSFLDNQDSAMQGVNRIIDQGEERKVKEKVKKKKGFLDKAIGVLGNLAGTKETFKEDTTGYVGRNSPVMGRGMRNLDKLAEVTKPAADVALELYTPGAGLGVLNSATRSAGALVSRLAPGLGKTLGGRVAKVAAQEAIVGAPTGIGNQLARDPQSTGKQLLEAGAYGAGGGAVLGGLGRAGFEGVQKGVESVRRAFMGAQGNQVNAIRSVLREDLPQNIRRTLSGANRLSEQVASEAPTSPGGLLSTFRSIRDAGVPEPAAQSAPPARLKDLRADSTPQVQGTRRNFATQLNKGNFSDELQKGIRDTDQSYDIATNEASAAAANEAVKDLSTASGRFLNNEAGGPEHIATGYRLMQELDAKGDYEGALAVSRKLAEDLTKSGQTTQAASIISRLSPEGQLLNLIRVAEKNGKEVTLADSVKFKELAAKVQEKSAAGIKANQFNEILNRMERGENVSVADIKKLSDYLSGTEKVVKPKAIVDDLPTEFKDVKKRDKIISFLDDAEQAALARIAARKSRLNALPLDEWADHAIVVSAQIAKGTIKAATHVEDLVKMFGEEIRPVATQVFQQAQKLVTGVSRRAGEGDIDKAREILRRASGQSDAEKAIVSETAAHVKKLIADAKAGKLDAADIQKLRDYSDEIAEMLEDAKPRRVPTQEEKFLQSVKSLAKKIAQVESEKITIDQANREVSSLLRQVAKLADEGTPALKKEPIDNNALSDIAHDVMEKTRPSPKPTTLQEKIIEKYLKENPKVSQKDIDSLRDLAKNITRLSGDQRIDADIAMQKILNSYEKSSVWDKTLALRYMGMLLNTHTQAINALSGPIMSTTGVIADVFGTMIDIAMNKTLNTPRTTTLYGTNPLKYIARYVKNLKTGTRAGFQGVNPAGIQGTNEIRGLAFKSVKNPLTFIPAMGERVLGAVSKGPDFATYKSVFDSEIAKQGYLSAKNKGIKGRVNIRKHIEEFVNEPPEEAILQADRIGKNTTFQRSDTTGGKVANYLHTAPGLVKPGVNAIFPFVRTPINIASTAVTMTPAGIIKGLFQLTSKSDASRREAIRTLSMGITGTGIGALGYYLSQLGIITGANDSGDKDVDNIREQAGKGKYRFNTSALLRYLGAMVNGEGSEAAEKAAQYREGDKQFDYNKLQPLALPLAAGASLGNNKGKTTEGKVSDVLTDSFGSLFGMSTLKGVQSVFQPSYGGTQGEKALGVPSRIAESFFKSFSPGGLAQEARRQDPIQRKTPFNDGIIANTRDYFKSRTPGLSQSLPSRKTTLGQDYKNASGIKGSYLNPYRSEVAPYNKAAEIISGLIDRTRDLKLAPSAPEKTVRGKDRTGAQVSIKIPEDRYAQLQGDVGNEIIKRIISLPNLSDDKLAAEIEDIYTKVRKSKMDEVKKELGIRVSR